ASIQYQASRIPLYHFRKDELASTIAVVAVFHGQRKPPDLYFHPLIVELFHHLLYGIAGKCIWPRKPIAVVVVPAIIERGPVNPKIFHLRDRLKHLLWGDVRLVTPAAPADRIVFL